MLRHVRKNYTSHHRRNRLSQTVEAGTDSIDSYILNPKLGRPVEVFRDMCVMSK